MYYEAKSEMKTTVCYHLISMQHSESLTYTQMYAEREEERNEIATTHLHVHTQTTNKGSKTSQYPTQQHPEAPNPNPNNKKEDRKQSTYIIEKPTWPKRKK